MVRDKHKKIKEATIVITTTFEYQTGEDATYKMKDSDRDKLRKVITDV